MKSLERELHIYILISEQGCVDFSLDGYSRRKVDGGKSIVLQQYNVQIDFFESFLTYMQRIFADGIKILHPTSRGLCSPLFYLPT